MFELYPLAGKPGWFLTPDGDRVFMPVAACDHHQRRQALAEIEIEDLDDCRRRLTLADLDAVRVHREPGVFAVAINGRLPRPENVRQIRKAVEEIPSRFRSVWLNAGGRLEIIAGTDARLDPRFAYYERPVLGMSRNVLAVVAGDDTDAERTACHEIGHCLDNILRISRRPAWVRIWEHNRSWGRVPDFTDQNRLAREYFAEMFASYVTGGADFLGEAIRVFMYSIL